MANYPGIYKAYCERVDSGVISLYVPQVFGDVRLKTANATGNAPSGGTEGWVMFESGLAEYPVWVSATAGVSSYTPSMVAHSYLWGAGVSRTAVSRGRVVIIPGVARATDTLQISQHDSLGVDAQLMIEALMPGDLVMLASDQLSFTWNRYSVQGNPVKFSGYYEIPVTLVATSGSEPLTNEPLRVGIFLSGAAGAPVVGSSYVHDQMTPSMVWTVNHNLGFYPGGIQISDSSGADVEGEVSLVSVNQLTISFSVAISGHAYVS